MHVPIYSSGNPVFLNFLVDNFERFLEVSMLQELCCLHDYCTIFSILSFFFSPWISQLLLSLKCQLCYQYPLDTQLHLLLPQTQTSALGADLGTKVYTNYYWLLMLRTPLTRTGMLPNMPPLSSSISTNVISDLGSQIFKISHYRKTSMSLFCLSLIFSLPLCIFHCLFLNKIYFFCFR